MKGDRHLICFYNNLNGCVNDKPEQRLEQAKLAALLGELFFAGVSSSRLGTVTKRSFFMAITLSKRECRNAI